jgi:hypothetical protein
VITRLLRRVDLRLRRGGEKEVTPDVEESAESSAEEPSAQEPAAEGQPEEETPAGEVPAEVAVDAVRRAASVGRGYGRGDAWGGAHNSRRLIAA